MDADRIRAKFLWTRITAHLNINETNLAGKPEEKSCQRYGQPFHRLKFYERWNHTGSRKGEADVRTCACALRHKCHKKTVKFRGTFGTVHTSLNDMRKEMRKAKFFSNTCLAPTCPLTKQSKYESTCAGFEDTHVPPTQSLRDTFKCVPPEITDKNEIMKTLLNIYETSKLYNKTYRPSLQTHRLVCFWWRLPKHSLAWK